MTCRWTVPWRWSWLRCGGVPSETSHHATGPLTVAVGLAATAGFVDAFIFQHVTPVFVANMSGNLIHFGMALGNVRWSSAGIAAIALAAFAGGAFAGTWALDRHVAGGRPPDPSSLLLAEVALLLVVTVITLATEVEFSAELSASHVVIIVLASVAMGGQSVAVRRVGATAVSTTYGTGALVRVSEKVVLGLRRAPRNHDLPRRRSVLVLASIIVGYVGGAIVASALPGAPGVLRDRAGGHTGTRPSGAQPAAAAALGRVIPTRT